MKKSSKTKSSIFSFIQYTLHKRSSWLIVLLSLVFINTFVGVLTVFLPKIILMIIRLNKDSIKHMIALIVLIQVVFFLLKSVFLRLKNRTKILSDELFRHAYADLGKSQSHLKYERSISPESLQLLEAGKYGIWEIPPLSDKLEKLGTSIVLLAINMGILFMYAKSYIIIPILSFFVLLPLYHYAMKIELDNAKRLLPENRAFGWFCKLITDFRFGEDIRIYKGEQLILSRCKSLMDRIYRINQKAFSNKGFVLGIVKFLFQLEIVIIVVLLGYTTMKETLMIEDFVLLFSAASAISGASNELVSGFNQIRKLDAVISPFFEFTKEVDSHKKVEDRGQRERVRELTFENVSFTYPGSSKKAVDHLSFTIFSDEKVGIVGRNGAGKSTIVKLICGLYTPQAGRILFDGEDITTMPENKYREYISILFQDFQLLPVTILENILCKEKEKITESERAKFDALFKSIHMNKWLESLEKGEDTYISPFFSEDHVLPSGGQAQVLAMQRALFRDASIYIFDEPTRALDSMNEKLILNQLESLEDKICIMISHRLSHVRRMDRIMVMDKGRVIEDGTHEILMQYDSVYRLLYSSQAKKYGVNLSSNEMGLV